MKNIKKQVALLPFLAVILASCTFSPIPSTSDSESLSNSNSDSVSPSETPSPSTSEVPSSSVSEIPSSSVSEVPSPSVSEVTSPSEDPSLSEEPSVPTNDWSLLGYATSYTEATTRTKNKLSSGNTVDKSTYLPADNEDAPKDINGNYCFVTDTHFDEDETSYTINMLDGSNGPTIYKGGVYTSLEDVAAYLFAFGELPVNSNYGKNAKKASIADWGKLGRVNNDYYSNNTSNYPYEPELPNYSRLTPSLKYYYTETDYGPDIYNDESYVESSGIYNNGKTINRGVSRFCITTEYDNSSDTLKVLDRHVFYTYNHYNDFQEYLNYYGGWGERFGGMTAGNEYGGSKYTPTTYPMPTYTSLDNI